MRISTIAATGQNEDELGSGPTKVSPSRFSGSDPSWFDCKDEANDSTPGVGVSESKGPYVG